MNIFTVYTGSSFYAFLNVFRVCGVSIMISSLLNIVMPFALQRNKIYVFIIRAIQGLVEVGTFVDFNSI